MYTTLFERLGLSETDSQVYKALLELKSATPAEVAKVAHVPRELTYYILKKLSKDGLVRQDPEADKQRFELLLPETFKKEIDKQKQQMKIAQGELENLFSIVQRQLETTESSTSVKYYSGTEGIKHAYVDFLKGCEGQTQYGVINYHWKANLEGYFLQKRLIYNVKLRMIIADTERGRRLASKRFLRKP